MKTRDFNYSLPEHLIAQKPCDIRSQSRLFHYSRTDQSINHLKFHNILDLLNPGDLLVFNNTRVIPARIYGYKETGGKVEILVERVTGEQQCLAHIKASKSPRPGRNLVLCDKDKKHEFTVTVTGREGDLFILSINSASSIANIMESVGHMPLPPYINREDTVDDFSRYQTVYAEAPGAVAAPTAGLHFDEDLLQKELKDLGVSGHIEGVINPWYYRKKNKGTWIKIGESGEIEKNFPVKWDTTELKNGQYKVMGLMHVFIKKGREEKTIARQNVVEVTVEN